MTDVLHVCHVLAANAVCRVWLDDRLTECVAADGRTGKKVGHRSLAGWLELIEKKEDV